MAKKYTLKEIEEKLKENNKNLSVIDERFITTKTKTRREILIKNSETGSTFWAQTSRILSNTYNYNIVRYNTETVKNMINKLTNGEYELIGECNKFDSQITVLHKKCNRTYNYRASHFINDNNRCQHCVHDSLRKTNEEFDKELMAKSSKIIRKGEYKGYHSEIVLHCTICNKDFITKPVDIDKQFKTFEELHCPNCNEKYYGELYINEILKDMNLIFRRQYSNKECKDKRPLRFDFAIFDESANLKALIEYDGSQHRDPNSKYAKGRFDEIVYHDKLKDDFCSKNNIPLLRTSSTTKKKLKNEIERFLLK